MTQQELERQISEKTGESIQAIRNLGFSPLRESIPVEERSQPLIVDWDSEERSRNYQRRSI